MKKIAAISELIRLDKQYGTLLLMLPTLWSLMLATDGKPSLRLLIIFVLGSFLMRSAGCVINDISDRDFDRHVERTKERPLASGKISIKEAWALFVILISLCFLLVMLLNRFTIVLSPIGLLLAMIYPLIKRVLNIPQIVLGISFGWGSIMAWTAARGEIELPAVMIFLSTIFWATAYDTIYALMDKEDDLKIGVKSTAILFKEYTWLAVGILYLLVSIILFLLGNIAGLAKVYYLSIILITIFFLYHTIRVKKGISRDTAFILFKSNVLIGALVLIGIIADLRIG
ncbi:MAG: 4-hydroxybenzoate octaprenyltransferase [Nitrospirota bacterium]